MTRDEFKKKLVVGVMVVGTVLGVYFQWRSFQDTRHLCEEWHVFADAYKMQSMECDRLK